jgi:hypothetical protein
MGRAGERRWLHGLAWATALAALLPAAGPAQTPAPPAGALPPDQPAATGPVGQALAPPAAPGQAPLRIGTITLQTTSLFSAEEAARGSIYRLANRLHRPTRPRLIRAFLLFHEGDPYAPELIVESERNLRNLDFLKTVEIATGPPHDGVVDVLVKTQDAWRTNPSGELSRTEDATTYELDLTQRNFLGSGAGLSLAVSRDAERLMRTLELSTPLLFGRPYWNAKLLLSHNSDGSEKKLALARPYFSFANRWLFDGAADQLVETKRLYDQGDAIAGFRLRHRGWSAGAAYAFEASERRSRRLLAGFELLDDRFAPARGEPLAPLPADRNFRFFIAGYQEVANDFVKLAYVDQDLRVEDWNLGRQLAARVGASPGVGRGAGSAGLLRVEGSEGWRVGARGFLLSRLSYETRRERGRLANEIAAANLLCVLRLGARPLQTLVARLDVRRGIHLDRDVQFLADGLNGLRAYPLHAYGGDRRLLLNVEHRVFLGREVLQVFAPGAAVFFDAGAAPSPGTPFSHARFKSDIGAGLRFAIARAEGLVLRFDYAYQLSNDPFGHRGWVFTAGTGQAF